MDTERARTLLTNERAEVLDLLTGIKRAGEQAQQSEADAIEEFDRAEPLTAEGNDTEIAGTLRDRLAAIDRALARIDNGTYGVSVRSGKPIPDARLEADPAAELTVEEASRLSRTDRGARAAAAPSEAAGA